MWRRRPRYCPPYPVKKSDSEIHNISLSFSGLEIAAMSAHAVDTMHAISYINGLQQRFPVVPSVFAEVATSLSSPVVRAVTKD